MTELNAIIGVSARQWKINYSLERVRVVSVGVRAHAYRFSGPFIGVTLNGRLNIKRSRRATKNKYTTHRYNETSLSLSLSHSLSLSLCSREPKLNYPAF